MPPSPAGERFLRSRVEFGGQPDLSGSYDHASTWRLLCVPCWCLRDRDERRLVRPAAERAWTARGGRPACGAASCSISPFGASSHGPSFTASGSHSAAGRTGIPSRSPAASGYGGAASDATLRRTAAPSCTARCSSAARVPSWSGGAAAASGRGAAAGAPYRRTIAPQHVTCFERAAVATATARATA
jgi:hypothetical protein